MPVATEGPRPIKDAGAFESPRVTEGARAAEGAGPLRVPEPLRAPGPLGAPGPIKGARATEGAWPIWFVRNRVGAEGPWMALQS